MTVGSSPIKTAILVVDDDPRIRQMLQRYFEHEGYKVTCAASGEEMRLSLKAKAFDIILLDLVLPDQDGLDLAREIRRTSNIPIMILTGREDVVDCVVGLEIGADDYVVKPFHLREVHARLKSILRRYQAAPVPGPKEHDLLVFDGWQLDRQKRKLLNPENLEIELSSGEFDMLDAFIRNAGRVLSRDALMDLTRHRGRDAFDRSIDTQISRLRRKIEIDPARPELIKSIRSVGYVFTAKPAGAFIDERDR
ncbi:MULTISPECIES: response regulator [unclassified Rhizobium]|uniref:response regulator n=1 Tax=unclassified Rhizobium TaxID=2613769 RepID=UPI001613C290|nr:MULTISPECIES: response regulator [unclassified Rhizobium]MBB3545235.1 two-component system phosphate regulon response regulator OmpR [Rhizobium sp. BK399]MCS3743213.1 two-component system phosphate regulon response regulator OmpR [Rhizobium sp. BK661]MCS4096359.1 two-component system phosphate regulon response regulator OmpR [Rhizobium sp. BK176]